MPKKPKKTMTREAELQALVLAFLRARDIVHWRVPVGPVVHRLGIKGRVKEVWKKNPLKGFPDIAGVLTRQQKGRMFAVELKRANGRTSPEQISWITLLHDSGAAVALVRSFDELVEVMRGWGEID